LNRINLLFIFYADYYFILQVSIIKLLLFII